MDLFDGLDHGGSLTASFSSLQLESAMVIGVGTDVLFPIVQQQALADALAEKVSDVAFVALDSLQGHDSFLVDMDRFRPAMAAYFKPSPSRRRHCSVQLILRVGEGII